MSSAWLSAAIQEFEQVTLDNGTELFRIRARAQRGDDPEPRPVLVARDQDGLAQTYEPLSSGGDRRGLMRLAFTVPSDRVGPSTAFSLRLPDGYWIELPAPTPGGNRPEPEDGQLWEDLEPESELRDPLGADDGAARRITELEQELGEHRSSNDELRRQLAELTAEHERAHAERDAADEAAEAARAERDEALETARDGRRQHARLAARVRQLQARIELQRADVAGTRPGSDARVRQLEAEREQLAVHVRTLAELLLSTDEDAENDLREGHTDDSGGPGASGAAVATDPADRLETLRARAVEQANEDAERELRRLRAGTPL